MQYLMVAIKYDIDLNPGDGDLDETKSEIQARLNAVGMDDMQVLCVAETEDEETLLH